MATTTLAERVHIPANRIAASVNLQKPTTLPASSLHGVSYVDVLAMTRRQLKDTILNGRRPFNVPDANDRLDHMDRTTLQRLAFLALRSRAR